MTGCPPLGEALETIEVEQPGAGELHELLDVQDTPSLWEAATSDEALGRYREAVSARLGGKIEPRDTLLAQREVFAAFPGGAGEAANGTALLEGRAGAIGPIRCLELLLWRRQAARYPMLEHPTEFGAYILRSKDRVRVYFSSADRVGQKLRAEVRERVIADRKAGFEVVAHLHNHPFLFDRVVGDRLWTTPETLRDVAGAVAPSKADVQALRAMRETVGLQGAWVTNGLYTARFKADELDVLVAAE